MKSFFCHQTEKDKEIVMSSEEMTLKKRICESIEAARLQAQAKKAKRYRSAFTTEQINYLEKQFKKCPYIGNTSRKDVANVLNIPERAVKIWFQNRRMKEKKESNIKEPNLDRQNKSINNVEFVNDSLDNAHTSPSTNDRIYSLQSPTPNHPDIIKCTKINDVIDKKNTSFVKADTTRQDLKRTNSDELLQDSYLVNYSKMFRRTSAEIIRRSSTDVNNLNKVCVDSFLNTHENDTKAKTQNIIGKDVEIKTKEYPSLNAGSKITGCQELPEDLSAKNKCVTSTNNTGELKLGPAYSCVPFYNMQNYYTPCVSTGNVMWKPINVMPVLPSNTLPLAVTNNEISGVSQINVQEKNCNCNCHLKQPLNYQQGNSTSQQPQYVIAIPYTSNSHNRLPENVL